MSSNELVEAGGLRPQDFESIRDAVLETPRGRWFLNEYANRLRSSETIGIIDSMKRLENAVSSNHDALMARLADALAREAATPATSPPQADLAPKHMKFFKQDEEIFQPAPQAKIAAVPDVPKPEAKPEVPKGARVVIRRSTSSAEASLIANQPGEAPQPVASPSVELPVAPETASAAEPPVETAAVTTAASPEMEPLPAAPAPHEDPLQFAALPKFEALTSPFPPAETMPAPAVEAEAEAEAAPKRRIVIIRHKPGEQIDVPLQNEMAQAG